MPLITSFKAHASVITGICLVNSMIVTSSVDSNVRIFSESGNYVGTFGQQGVWDITDCNSYSKRPADISVLGNALAHLYNTAQVHEQKSVEKESLLATTNAVPLTDKPAEETVTNRWYTQSLYAKERLATRGTTAKFSTIPKCTKDNRKIHNLDEVTLPNFKKLSVNL